MYFAVIINLALAIIPSIVIISYFYKQDNLKPEPKGRVIKVFVWGCFSTLGALILERVVLHMGGRAPIPDRYMNLFLAFIVAGFCEEFIKLIVVKFAVFRAAEFNEVMDGIVYTIAASLGFAAVENFLYSGGGQSSIMLLLIRGVTAVPLHALASGIMGFYIGKSKFYPKSPVAPGFIVAVGIHGLYDYLLFTGNIYLSLINIPLLIGAFIILKILIKRAKELDVESGRV